MEDQIHKIIGKNYYIFSSIEKLEDNHKSHKFYISNEMKNLYSKSFYHLKVS